MRDLLGMLYRLKDPPNLVDNIIYIIHQYFLKAMSGVRIIHRSNINMYLVILGKNNYGIFIFQKGMTEI